MFQGWDWVFEPTPSRVDALDLVISQAGITAGQYYGEGVNLVGFETDTGSRSVTSLPQSIKKGDLSFRTTKPNVDGGILLGARLASRLSVYPGDVVTLGIDGDHARVLELVRAEPFVREASVEDDLIRLYVDQGDSAVPQLIRLLDGADLRARTLTLARPSLDDVFLRQTGRSLREEPAA